jgi:hypothetical protein
VHAVVVFESMYGNTHTVATHIADGLRPRFEVSVVPVGEATAAVMAGADLVVVGGPTHVHGLSSPKTRAAAQEAVAQPGQDLTLDPAANGDGLRDWFRTLGEGHHACAAAFDTRLEAPAVITGRAGKAIARRLQRHGFWLALEPESFLVDKKNHLLAGEADRATAWGSALRAAVAGATSPA